MLLQPPTYKKLKKDPTQVVKKRITDLLKDLKAAKHINMAMFNKLKPTNCFVPKFYGLPEVHQPDFPLRPIVSAITSPTFSLSKFIACIISPLAGKTNSYVKNSSHFKLMISEETIGFDEIMVSFDVKSLFTNVPLAEALDVIKDKLVKDENLDDRTTLNAEQITNLLEVCLRTTYFVFNKE